MTQNDPRKTGQNPSNPQAPGRQDKGQGAAQGSQHPEVPGRPDADKERDRNRATGPGGGRIDDAERRKNEGMTDDDTDPMRSGTKHTGQGAGASKGGAQHQRPNNA